MGQAQTAKQTSIYVSDETMNRVLQLCEEVLYLLNEAVKVFQGTGWDKCKTLKGLRTKLVISIYRLEAEMKLPRAKKDAALMRLLPILSAQLRAVKEKSLQKLGEVCCKEGANLEESQECAAAVADLQKMLRALSSAVESALGPKEPSDVAHEAA
jgi:ABC-type uncharacterized transport system ATPase subunit